MTDLLRLAAVVHSVCNLVLLTWLIAIVRRRRAVTRQMGRRLELLGRVLARSRRLQARPGFAVNSNQPWAT